MAAAFVQKSIVAGSTGVSSIQVGLTSVASGNLIVIYLTLANSTETLTSVTDNHSNSYAEAVERSGFSSPSPGQIAMWYAKDVTGGSLTITASASGSVANFYILAAEYSGLGTVSPLGQTGSAGGTGSPASPGGLTPTVDDNIVTSMAYTGDNPTVKSGYTSLFHFTPWWYSVGQYKETTSTATEDPSFAVSSWDWQCIGAVFQADAIGGGESLVHLEEQDAVFSVIGAKRAVLSPISEAGSVFGAIGRKTTTFSTIQEATTLFETHGRKLDSLASLLTADQVFAVVTEGTVILPHVAETNATFGAVGKKASSVGHISEQGSVFSAIGVKRAVVGLIEEVNTIFAAAFSGHVFLSAIGEVSRVFGIVGEFVGRGGQWLLIRRRRR